MGYATQTERLDASKLFAAAETQTGLSDWGLDPTFKVGIDKLIEAVEAFAAQRGKSKSLVAQAAIASFLSPDAAERQEAAVTRRLDQHTRIAERLERNLSISIEMIALFVRFWLTTTPQVPEARRAEAQAKGRERYEGFVAALGRRLAKGGGFAREVSMDLPAHDRG